MGIATCLFVLTTSGTWILQLDFRNCCTKPSGSRRKDAELQLPEMLQPEMLRPEVLLLPEVLRPEVLLPDVLPMPRPAVLRPEVLLPEVLPMLPHVNLRLYRHGALRMTMNMCDATLPTIRECQLSICSCWRCQLLCTCTSGTQARISVYWSSRCRCSSNTSGSYGRTTEPMSLRPMLSLADRSDKSMYESVRPSQSVGKPFAYINFELS